MGSICKIAEQSSECFWIFSIKTPSNQQNLWKKINSQINVAVCVQKSTNFLIVDIKSFLTTDVKAVWTVALSYLVFATFNTEYIAATAAAFDNNICRFFIWFLLFFFLVIQHQFKAFPNTVIHTLCHFSQSTLILWLLVLRAIFFGFKRFFCILTDKTIVTLNSLFKIKI